MAKKKSDANPAADATVPAAARRRRAATPRNTTTVASPASTADDRQSAIAALPDSMVNNNPSFDQIAEAAYLRYLSRGGSDGQDFEDWLEAERQLRSK